MRAKCGGVPDPEAVTVMSQPVIRLSTVDGAIRGTAFVIHRGLLGANSPYSTSCYCHTTLCIPACTIHLELRADPHTVRLNAVLL